MRKLLSHALGALLLSMTFMLTACYSSAVYPCDPAKTYCPNNNLAYRQPPSKTGTITISSAQFPDNVNPLLAHATGAWDIIPALWGTCLTTLPNPSIIANTYGPDQCAEVPTVANKGEAADGVSTTVKVAPQAVWSDGQAITAQDFCFGVDLASDPAIYGLPPFNHIQGCRVNDPHTFTVTWNDAYAAYLDALAHLTPFPLHSYANLFGGATYTYSSTAAQQLIQQANFLTVFPATNGAYTIQSFQPGVTVTLVKNPNYYSGVFHGPNADRIIFEGNKNRNQLAAAYKAQQINLAEDFTLPDVQGFGGIPQNEQRVTMGNVIDVLAFNQRAVAPSAAHNGAISPFADQAVRQAFTEAFDRCPAVANATGLDCREPFISVHETTDDGLPDYDSMVVGAKFDPTSAQNLLAAAGYPLDNATRAFHDGHTPFTVNLLIPQNDAMAQKLAASLAADWHTNLGVQTNIQTDDYAQAAMLSAGAFDVAIYPMQLSEEPLVNAETYLSARAIPGAPHQHGQNYAGFMDSGVQTLLGQATKELNDSKRDTLLRTLQRDVANTYAFVPLVNQPHIMLANTTLVESPHRLKPWRILGSSTLAPQDIPEGPNQPV